MRLFGVILLAVYSAIVAAHAAKDNLSYYRDFWNPNYHGKLLNYCLSNKNILLHGVNSCGKNVADKYCKFMGYDSSSKSIIAHNVGFTNYLDTCTGCKGWNCDGFTLIRCVSTIKHSPIKAYYFREQQFVLPRFGHYRIDWCYKNGKYCGQRVANSFCRRMGFVKAVQYKIDRKIKATKSLGNHKLCFGDGCNAFASITCYR